MGDEKHQHNSGSYKRKKYKKAVMRKGNGYCREPKQTQELTTRWSVRMIQRRLLHTEKRRTVQRNKNLSRKSNIIKVVSHMNFWRQIGLLCIGIQWFVGDFHFNASYVLHMLQLATWQHQCIPLLHIKVFI